MTTYSSQKIQASIRPEGFEPPSLSNRAATDPPLTPQSHLCPFTFSDYKCFNADIFLNNQPNDGNISVETCSLFV